MAEELNLKPAEHNDRTACQCPVCEQEFFDKCPPDCRQEKPIKCPQCGNWLIVTCEVTIEREYTMEVDYVTEK